MTDPVMAIHLKGDNSDLIASAARLGYLRDSDFILDATYGNGVFWKKWAPPSLLQVVKNDLNPAKGNCHFDFRDMPWMDAYFTVVVFDPDYKMQGTSSNAGPASSNPAYGMDRPYRPVAASKQLFYDGIVECWRVLKPGGFLLYKTMDQVVSGNVEWHALDAIDYIDEIDWPGPREEVAAARTVRTLGGRWIDWLMLMGHRAQPVRTRKCPECRGNRTTFRSLYEVRPGGSEACPECNGSGRVPSPQQHAARNYSSLLIFQKGRK